MKRLFGFITIVLLVAGCASPSAKLNKRKQERYSAYAALSTEMKEAVDHAQIKVGMSEDAVYIAWGKPAQVLASETSAGTVVTWLYQADQLVEYRYWTYYGYRHGGNYWGHPYLQTDYYPQKFVSAEVIFEKGVVKQWRTLPAPLN